MNIDHPQNGDGKDRPTDQRGAEVVYRLLSSSADSFGWARVKSLCEKHVFGIGNSLLVRRVEPNFLSRADAELESDPNPNVLHALLPAAIQYVVQTRHPPYEFFASASRLLISAASSLADTPDRRVLWQNSAKPQTIIDLTFLCTHCRGTQQFQADLALAAAILLIGRKPLSLLVPKVVDAFRAFEPAKVQVQDKDHFSTVSYLYDGFWCCVMKRVDAELVMATDLVAGDSAFGAAYLGSLGVAHEEISDACKSRLLNPRHPWQAAFFASLTRKTAIVAQSELIASLTKGPESPEPMSLWGPRACFALSDPCSEAERRIIWHYAAEKARDSELAHGCREFLETIVGGLPPANGSQPSLWSDVEALYERLYPSDLDRIAIEGILDMDSEGVEEEDEEAQVYQEICAYLERRDPEQFPAENEICGFERFLRRGNDPVLFRTVALEVPDISVFFEAFNDIMAGRHYFTAALCIGQVWNALTDAVVTGDGDERDAAWRVASGEMVDKLWRLLMLALDSNELDKLLVYACCDFHDSIDTIRRLAAGVHINDSDGQVDVVDLREVSLVAAAYLDFLDCSSLDDSERALREHLQYGRTTPTPFRNFGPIQMVRIIARRDPLAAIELVDGLIAERRRPWWIAAGLCDTVPDHAPHFFSWYRERRPSLQGAAEAVFLTGRDLYEQGDPLLDLVGEEIASRRVSMNSIGLVLRLGYRISDVVTVFRALGEISDPSVIREICASLPDILDRIERRSRGGVHPEL